MIEFSKLELRCWRQFDSIELDLSKQVTVITGQNGCGKTTLLNILNRHFGWNLNFVSAPFVGKKTSRKIWSDIYRPQLKKDDGKSEHNDSDADDIENLINVGMIIGKIVYDNGAVCDITVNTVVSSQYHPNFHAMQPVVGLHIPSHRPVASYTNVPNIPTDPRSATQEYQQYQQLLIQFYGGSRGDNPGKIQKQSLISFAVFGEGNSSVNPNPEIKKHYDEFQEVLRKVMPPSIGFRRLEIRMPEVVLITDSGEFSLDAMSGGVNAIFGIAWQIHMFGQDTRKLTVTIDEPENHLHPSMQRTLLPNLASAFPTAKFIISTHSPFIVSSFEGANIYALVKNESRRIVSQKLDVADVAGTPNEVLREILDVDSNLPVWVENRILGVIKSSASADAVDQARLIMDELERLGIADAIVEYQRSKPNAKGN